MRKLRQLRDLGRLGYADAFALQQQLLSSSASRERFLISC